MKQLGKVGAFSLKFGALIRIRIDQASQSEGV